MEEKICNNCGYHNSKEAKFCTGCGNSLEGAIVSKVIDNTVAINQNNTINNEGQNKKTNGFAIASLVLGIISVTIGFFIASIWFPLLAVTFSVLAKQKINAFNQEGKGMATAGLILGIIGFVLWALAFILKIINIWN